MSSNAIRDFKDNARFMNNNFEHRLKIFHCLVPWVSIRLDSEPNPFVGKPEMHPKSSIPGARREGQWT